VALPTLKIASVVAVYAFPLGALETTMIQFAPSVDFDTLTPSACGVPPGPLIKPETITYSTAASTTVIATIRMVAITGDTAASSFRMMLFMVLSSCGIPHDLTPVTLALRIVSCFIFEVENERIGYAREMERKEKREA